MIIENFILMHIKNTENGLAITKEMAEKSYQSFNGVPVILVDKSIKRDYLIDDTYINDRVIGVIVDDSARIEGDTILGTVCIWEKYSPEPCTKTQYDNWCISLYEDSTKFTVDAIELFKEVCIDEQCKKSSNI